MFIGPFTGNIKIKDYGDIRYTPEASPGYKNMENYEKVIGCNKVLFEKMKQAFKENDQVLTLGGDHSMAIGKCLVRFYVGKYKETVYICRFCIRSFRS